MAPAYAYAWNDELSSQEKKIEDIDASNYQDKTDFFRFIGLETTRDRDLDFENNNTKKFSDLHLIKNMIPGDCSLDEKIEETCKKGILKLRECSVRIVGKACKMCNRHFKCITDVKAHMKKRHRRKPKTKIVHLKIGDETISRLLVRRKHLKRFSHRQMNNRMEEKIPRDRRSLESDQIKIDSMKEKSSIDEVAINLNSGLDRDTISTNLLQDRRTDLQIEPNNNDDSIIIIKEVVGTKKSNVEHEIDRGTKTRGLLLSEALCEFDRIEKDRGKKSVSERKNMRNSLDDPWLDDRSTFHKIQSNEHFFQNYLPNSDPENAMDIASLTKQLAIQFFTENDSLNEKHANYAESLPDFIDYADCFGADYRFRLINREKSLNTCH